MHDGNPQFLDVGGRQIAVLADAPPPGAKASLFWLPGFASDMESTKAAALAAFARGRLGMTRFDVSGTGRSSGSFVDGTIGRWLDEAEAVFKARTAGPQVVIGSSMGGWIALLLLRRLIEGAPKEAARIRALVLIAPAWDFTEELIWRGLTPYQQGALVRDGQFLGPADGGGSQVFTWALIEEGRAHLIGGLTWNPGRRVHVLQGLRDVAVPPAHVGKLKEMLTGGHLIIEEIPDGDHRLSRPQDITRLCEVAAGLAG